MGSNTSSNSDLEHMRSNDLVRLMPDACSSSADIGARDGRFSLLLANKYTSILAIDLQKPRILHDSITCMQGDITNLEGVQNSVDFVLCSEVLEHIPTLQLEKACSELTRITKKYLLLGVPYKQDIRVGRTTCQDCGKHSPPWGHVNVFDEKKLGDLFKDLEVEEISYVGKAKITTNTLSTWLMDIAGNPYGTYHQEERCVHCDSVIASPGQRNTFQKVLTKIAFLLCFFTNSFRKPKPVWIHILYKKP